MKALIVARLMCLILFASSDAPTVEHHAGVEHRDIVAAWEARQSSVRFATLVWSEARTIPAKRLSSRDSRTAVQESQPDLVVSIPRVRLRLGGNAGQIRLETENLNSRADGLDPHFSVSLFDGANGMAYSGPREGQVGTAVLDGSFSDKSTLSLRAPILVFRALDLALNDLDLATFRVQPMPVVIDERTCVVLHEPAGTRFEGLSSFIYVDPARDFVPVRFTEMVGQAVVAQVEIVYRDGADGVRVPASWRGGIYSSAGSLREAVAAQVEEFEINEPIPKEDFESAIPPETKVLDKRTGDNYYIDRKKNSQRLETGGARVVPQTDARRGWIWTINTIVLVIVAAIFAFRKLRQRRRG